MYLYLKIIGLLVFGLLSVDVVIGKTVENPNNNNVNVAPAPDIGNENNRIPKGPEPIATSAKGLNKMKLSEDPSCKDDLTRLCEDSTLGNNFAVLDCIQKFKKLEENDLRSECQNVIWKFKIDLTKDDKFLDAARQVCKDEIKQFTDCQPMNGVSGHMISCLMDFQDNITNNQCKQFLIKMGSIIFSDYRLISKFTESCNSDIDKFHCGRIGQSDAKITHSQGETIACLSANPKELKEECRHEILRIAELQSDDFHLDRVLYFACLEDRDKFCENIVSGDGRVYRCLMNHKNEPTMSSECHGKLSQRQKLISQDYKASKGLTKACREHIKEFNCREQTSRNREIRLAQILVCLENALHLGSHIKGECQTEMLSHRRILLEEYQVNPNLVEACEEDISKFCNSKLEGSGKTLHCLMEHARPSNRKKKRIAEPCKLEVQKLILQADAGENWQVDPVLKEACQSVVYTACKNIQAGEGRILSCLMDKVGSDAMTDDCEEQLLQIQYFVARDMRLDPKLFHSCRDDAKKYCSAGEIWSDDPSKAGPERGPLLPCLYRYADKKKLSQQCVREIRRVMKQRALSVDLHPEIEASCMDDLTRLCLENTNKGEELVCLQDHLEKLKPDCRSAIGNYTEEEAEHIELNSVLMKACEPLAHKYCEDLMTGTLDHGEMMQCLLEHKREYDVVENEKCFAGIQHFQLLSLKDYRFSFKFKEACKGDVMKFCHNIRTKAEVVSCLSECVRNDTLSDSKPRISKECRQQLKVELLQRNENIDLDPGLKDVCRHDIGEFCKGITPGNSAILDCLKINQRYLGSECYQKVFNRQQDEMLDNSIDYSIVTVCKKMIRFFCPESSVSDALMCLKDFKDDQKFDPKCRGLVIKRMIQQNLDYRLNPQLMKSCNQDISKFCGKVIHEKQSSKSFEGRVIECLKDKFQVSRLSSSCEKEIGKIVREVQSDYHQDPLLADACETDIKELCNNQTIDPNLKGGVEECLKLNFDKNLIKKPECLKQVAKLIEEGSMDIQLDPVLHKACALDVNQNCHDVPAGEGRLIKCLKGILQSQSKTLRAECKDVLTKRFQMYQHAAQVAPPETLQDVLEKVSHSPARIYFIVIGLAFIGVIFFSGLFCGRVTKRVHHEMKRK